jgi:hypothetical protein
MCATLNPFLQDADVPNSGNRYIRLYDPHSGSLYFTPGYGYSHDIEYVIRDGVYPVDLSIKYPENNYSQDGWYRSIGLKGPPIIVGWGTDINGKPVPNKNEIPGSGGSSADFADDWLQRPDLWKAGPLDIRWDYKRGVWTSPPSNRMVQVKFTGEEFCSGSLDYNNGAYDVSMHYATIFDDNLSAYDESGNKLTEKKIVVHTKDTFAASSGTTGWVFYNPDKVHPSGRILANYQKYEHIQTGSTGGGTIRFRVLSTGPFYGTGESVSDAECVTVVGEILDVSCGLQGVSVGDEVIVWDPNGCWFNIPIENIENMYGTAMKMARGGEYEDWSCFDSLDYQDPNCFWEVINLCCTEEVGTI